MDRTGRKAARELQQALRLAMLTALLVLPSFSQEASPHKAPAPKATTAAANLAARVVLVSIPDRQLAVLDGGNVIARFPVAVGAEASPSPAGEFRIVSRISHPTYYRPGTVIPAGKDNPLGTRWLGLSQKGYGIHGTNAPRSIGHARSHGCIRLRNRDMEHLFALLRVGDVVEIRGERDEEIAQIFGGEVEEAAATTDDPAADESSAELR